MLTTQINTDTFIIGSETYNVGDEMPLTKKEQGYLKRCHELTTLVSEKRSELLRLCHEATTSFDQDLANKFYEYENEQFEYNTASTALLRGICKRIGGLIPLQIDYRDTPNVKIRPLNPQESSVLLTTDVVKQGCQYNRAMGDVRELFSRLLDKDPKKGFEKAATDIDGWERFGTPYLEAKTADLGFDVNYANGLTEFDWEDHEDLELDAILMKSFQETINLPNRMNGLRNNTAPWPFAVLVIGPETTYAMNVSAVSSGTDEERIDLIKKRATDVDAKFVIFVQFGPLTREGSTIDFEGDVPVNQQAVGFSLMFAAHTGPEIIVGAKSWKASINPQNGQAGLAPYAIFEGLPGLPSDQGLSVVRGLFSTPLDETQTNNTDTQEVEEAKV